MCEIVFNYDYCNKLWTPRPRAAVAKWGIPENARYVIDLPIFEASCTLYMQRILITGYICSDYETSKSCLSKTEENGFTPGGVYKEECIPHTMGREQYCY